jgi:hypothetical protein
MRAVVDVLRPRWPARMGCVIDTMFNAEQIAVGIAPRGTTVVIETTAAVTCPALSHVGDTMWVATIGDGMVVDGERSVLDDARRERARAYLVSAPLVATLELAGGTAIATARPQPLEAWLAFDTTPELAPVVETRMKTYLESLANRPVTGPFVQRVAVARQGSQVVAKLDGPVDADLAVAVRLAIAEAGPSAPEEAALPCPPIVAPVTACDAGPVLRVSALGAAVAPIVAAPLLPVIENTRVRGLRLGAAVPALGLDENDVIVSAGGRPVVNRVQASEILRRAKRRIALVIERDRRTSTLSLVEP